MQKGFYYKLFKRLGLFPSATFDDIVQSISFGGTAASQILVGGTTIISLNKYYSLGGQHTGGSVSQVPGSETVFPRAGTLSLFVLTGDADAGSPTEIISVVKNTVATSLQAIVAAGARTAQDTTHTLHVNTGDTVSVFYDPASSGNFGKASWACVFTPDPS